MFNGIPFLSSPFPWVFLAAVAFGAAVSRATMSTRRRTEAATDRARTGKWVFFCLYLSAAVLLCMAGLFIPGASKFLDPRLAYLACVAAAVSFLAFRFKRTAGLVVVVLVALVCGATALFLRSVTAFTGETEIARVHVLTSTPSQIKLELEPSQGEPVLLTMEGSYFAPIVKVVIFDDFWVFLGAKTWYRFVGVTSFREVAQNNRTEFKQGNTDFYFSNPPGIAQSVWSFFERNEQAIPGVKTVQINVDMKRAKDLATYSVKVQNDGGVEIVPLN